MVAIVTKLPYAVGRLTLRWALLLAALLPIVGLGIFAYSRQYTEGEVITGMRDLGPMGGAPWGIYVVFTMGVGVAGISVAALVRVFHMHTLRPLVRMAEVLSIVALLLVWPP